METPSTGLRKRQQISRANKMMFLWVAGVSVVVGISIVLIVFLAQKIVYGEKVIAEKDKTNRTLETNLKTVNELKQKITVLNTDEALRSTRLNESDRPIQSVLDALPASANSTAFAASLQTKLLTGVSGVALETLTVEPVSGVETSSDSSTSTVSTSTPAGENQIAFAFSVSANQSNITALRQVLERLEKSIRPINVTALSVEAQGDRLIMQVTGVSYYDSAKTVQLVEKVVKP